MGLGAGMLERSKYSILVVDDSIEIGRCLYKVFSKAGYRVTIANSGTEAVELIAENPFDLIIADLKMPDMNGIELLKRTKKINSQSKVIILTAYYDTLSREEVIKAGAFDYLRKPIKRDELLSYAQKALENKGVK